MTVTTWDAAYATWDDPHIPWDGQTLARPIVEVAFGVAGREPLDEASNRQFSSTDSTLNPTSWDVRAEFVIDDARTLNEVYRRLMFRGDSGDDLSVWVAFRRRADGSYSAAFQHRSGANVFYIAPFVSTVPRFRLRWVWDNAAGTSTLYAADPDDGTLAATTWAFLDQVTPGTAPTLSSFAEWRIGFDAASQGRVTEAEFITGGSTVAAPVATDGDSDSYGVEWTFADYIASEWVEVTDDVRVAPGISTSRGRTTDLGAYQAGSMSLRLDNRTRTYDPDFASGPHFGTITPGVPIRLRAVWGPTTHDVWRGFVRSWRPSFAIGGDAWTDVECSDIITDLSAIALLGDWAEVAASLGPVGLWMLDETTGSTFADQAEAANDLTASGSPTLAHLSPFTGGARKVATFGSGDSATVTAAELNIDTATLVAWLRLDPGQTGDVLSLAVGANEILSVAADYAESITATMYADATEATGLVRSFGRDFAMLSLRADSTGAGSSGSISVTPTSDGVCFSDGTGFDGGGATILVASSTTASVRRGAGVRFAASIPSGVTIDSADLVLDLFGEDDPDITVYGHDVDDAAEVTSGDIFTRTRTTASTSWDDTGLGNGPQRVDVTAIVQEIVDRGGWSSGQGIALLVLGDSAASSEVRWKSLEATDPSKRPRLEVTWTAPGPATGTMALGLQGEASVDEVTGLSFTDAGVGDATLTIASGFLGGLGGLALFDRELTDSEIRALFVAGADRFVAAGAGDRVDRLAGLGRVPSAMRTLDDGESATAEVAFTGSVWDAISSTAAGEVGDAFISGAGALTFRDRSHRSTDAAAAAEQFGDTANLPYSGIELAFDDDSLANEVKVTSTPLGITAVASDQASIRDYGVRASSISTPLASVAELDAAAAEILSRTKDVATRLRRLTVTIGRDADALADAVLGLELLDRIEVTRTPAVGSALVIEGHVASVAHSIGASEWVTSLGLEVAT